MICSPCAGSRVDGFHTRCSSDPSVEPEPASVVARLKKEALDNPKKEQSVEDLLSSMGVSLFADQRMLDYSMAVEYGGSKTPSSKNSEIEESENSLDSIPVAVPLSLPGIKKPVVSKHMMAVMQLAARERQIQMEMNENNNATSKAGSWKAAGASASRSQNDVKGVPHLEALQEVSNGVEESTAEIEPNMAGEKKHAKELSHSELCSIDVSSAASPVSQSLHDR